MANNGYTSPFPTSHDTIGQSTLVTPLFMRSSPPQRPTSQSPSRSPLRPESPLSDDFDPHAEDPDEREPPHNDEHDELEEHGHDDEHENEPHHLSHHSAPDSPTGSDLDARLAEYTLDFSQFPSGHFTDGQDDMPLPDMKDDMEDRLSDVGGPEDFTANMEKYLMGEDMSSVRKSRVNEDRDEPGSAIRNFSLRSRQPAVEEDADSAEYSEFGPPVDMSTPSHMLHRTSGLAKDSTRLDDIEEDPADELPSPESPASRRMSNNSRDIAHEREEDLQQRIAQLEDELHDRDEQLLRNRHSLLEAASASEQVLHLQTELQLKNEHIADIEAQNGDQEILREQIQTLRRQMSERDRIIQQSQANALDLSPLQQQIRDMQHQLKNQESQSSLDTERLETIAHLRQQLNLTQEQLKKRDATLEETLARLSEVTHAKEIQLHEKNSEIDRIQANLDDMALENEKLGAELQSVNADYQSLEDRLTNLETKNQPLEERNQFLEADLSRVQSHLEAQENALKSMAADLPIDSRSTYSEILDLIKDLGPPEADMEPEESPPRQKYPVNSEIQHLRDEIARLEQEIQDAFGAQKAAENEAGRLREQTTEMQSLIKTVESENLRLTGRVEELTTTLNKTQHDLTRTQEEHAESLETVARLQEEAIGQPPSPPPSPPMAHGAIGSIQDHPDTVALEETHQAQIRSLQTAHSTAISTLRSSHAESMRKIRNLLASAEQREADLRVELTTIRTSISTQESQLRKSLRSEIKRLEAVIAAKDETAVAMDQRIALSVDKREREWEARVDLLLKERDRMAKALMMYWGEKEMGRGPGVLAEGKENRRLDGDSKESKQGQAYRYKYAQKQRSKSGEKKP
ncbi:uncharacterized protein N7483_000873 [Penicillium malachiteum]|uniref:uncharacterized protein n=1 Tax=Penicillium malachiteum TaxID=1324776 RepID=UPI002546DA78|nr:uncharacterized protein N7483_000873 [Penicillium malachiteum]KAJ5735748.1 hypothetical protein N7483_000873 [Penicillium malachiteum]